MAPILTEEQYLPLAVALEHRRREQQRGVKLLFTPLPPCLECGEPPRTIVMDRDYGFTSDVTLVKLSCGHFYVVTNSLIFKTSEQVNRIVDAEENRPAGSRTEPLPRAPRGPVHRDFAGHPLAVGTGVAYLDTAEQRLYAGTVEVVNTDQIVIKSGGCLTIHRGEPREPMADFPGGIYFTGISTT